MKDRLIEVIRNKGLGFNEIVIDITVNEYIFNTIELDVIEDEIYLHTFDDDLDIIINFFDLNIDEQILVYNIINGITLKYI